VEKKIRGRKKKTKNKERQKQLKNWWGSAYVHRERKRVEGI